MPHLFLGDARAELWPDCAGTLAAREAISMMSELLDMGCEQVIPMLEARAWFIDTVAAEQAEFGKAMTGEGLLEMVGLLE